MTILSGQSVISRVYTSRFGNGTARLEPRGGTKKVPGTRYSNPPNVNRTMQWKSSIRLCTKIVLDLGASEEKYIHLATGQHAMNVCVSVCVHVCGQI